MFNASTRHLHDHTLTSLVNRKTTNLNAVFVLDRPHKRGFANDLDKLFASISVLVDLADVSRTHCFVKRNIKGQVNATEPGGARLLSVFWSIAVEEATHQCGINADEISRWWLISRSCIWPVKLSTEMLASRNNAAVANS